MSFGADLWTRALTQRMEIRSTRPTAGVVSEQIVTRNRIRKNDRNANRKKRYLNQYATLPNERAKNSVLLWFHLAFIGQHRA